MPDARRASRRRRQDWRAYLSTQAADGKPAINARERIGNGPWQNFKGTVVATSVDDLHSANNKLSFDNSISERGFIIPGVGFAPNRHDVLTGSTTEGRAFPAGEDRTCRNWTSSTAGRGHARPHRQKGSARRRRREVMEFVASLSRPGWRMQPDGPARHGRRRPVLLLREQLTQHETVNCKGAELAKPGSACFCGVHGWPHAQARSERRGEDTARLGGGRRPERLASLPRIREIG